MNGACIRRAWKRKGLSGKALWLLLLPASCLYLFVVQIRNALYSLGWLRSRSLEQAVVSVGNLTVGGTGKTPTSVWLAQELAKRGLKVGILSRGYRRKSTRPILLETGGKTAGGLDAEEDILAAGDEPAMMARIYGQTVGVAKERYQAAEQLAVKQNVDVFILDDGFQHRQLKRDVDLLLLGADAKGWVLPSGPFREPKGALRRSDFYLLTGAREQWEDVIRPGQVSQCFVGSLKAKMLVGFEVDRWNEYPLSLLYRSRVLTVTAIADPTSFYRMIHEWEGEIVDTLEFADHHRFVSADWQRINRQSRDMDFIVTTEKDILKLMRFPFARGKLLALRVEMSVENGDSLAQAIFDRIQRRKRVA